MTPAVLVAALGVGVFLVLLFLVHAVLALIEMVRTWKDTMTKTFDDMTQVLQDINTTTNEIADDVQTLIDRLNAVPDQGLTMEEATAIKGALDSLKTRLTSVAAEYPPVPAPVPVPVPEPAPVPEPEPAPVDTTVDTTADNNSGNESL